MTVHQTMVAIMTTAFLTQIYSATMVATTGLTGKTSAQATTEVMDSNILTLMRIESGSKFHNILLNLKCNLYNVNLYG